MFAAVALKGLLEVLTSEGTVMVMTSNRATDDLNNQGLNEDLFDHFVTSLQARTDSVQVCSRPHLFPIKQRQATTLLLATATALSLLTDNLRRTM